MVTGTAWQILGNMRIHQPRLAATNLGEGVPQGRLAFPKRLYFGSDEHQARFELVAKGVVVRGRAILRDDLHAFVLLFLLGRFHESNMIAAGRDISQVADSPRVPTISIHAFATKSRHGGISF